MSSPLSALPTPLFVNARTGHAAPALSPASLPHIIEDLPGARERLDNTKVLATDWMVTDPTDLTQTGWGVLFASDADPAIRTQLDPLLKLRQRQVGQDSALFRIFDGANGVLPGQTAEEWALQHSVSLTAAVDPSQGVPYYLLIVGSPERIPFEFQLLLKMQWAVGRLSFDDIEDYGRYARAIAEYDSDDFQPQQAKNAAVWVTRNRGNLAAAMLSGAISQGFINASPPLGSSRFALDAFPDAKATKQQLIEILRGNIPGGPPAILFTGSHGVSYPLDDPDQQRLQGALITQEWTEGSSVSDANLFSAQDIPADAKLHGTVAFLFACFGGGCPDFDSYHFNDDGTSIQIARKPLISALGQALLAHGALAVIAHIDTAFADCFLDVNGVPQTNVLRAPLEYLMQGRRVGAAADSLTITWGSLSSRVALTAGKETSPAKLANLVIARDDARNFIVLGDPAARLRLKDLR